VKEQTSQRTLTLRSIIKEAEQLEKDLMGAQVEQLKMMQTVVESLSRFIESRVVELDEYSAEVMASHEVEMKRLAAEQQRIDMEIGHTEKEEEVIREETESVEASIEGQTSDLMARKEGIQSKMADVDSEIAKLEAALRSKRAERERLTQELGSTDSEIQKIRSKFDRQLQRLKEKEKSLAGSRAECVAEETVLKKQKESFEKACAAVKSEQTRRKALVDSAREELNVATMLTSTFTAQVRIDAHRKIPSHPFYSDNPDWGGMYVDFQEEYQKVLEMDVSQSTLTELHKLQEQVKEAEDKAHGVTQEYNSLKARIDGLREEIDSIETRIPLLEHAKKEAAANKNYKDAAAKSKEIKVLQTRKDEAEAEMGEAKEGVDSLQQSVNEVQQVVTERRWRRCARGSFRPSSRPQLPFWNICALPGW